MSGVPGMGPIAGRSLGYGGCEGVFGVEEVGVRGVWGPRGGCRGLISGGLGYGSVKGVVGVGGIGVQGEHGGSLASHGGLWGPWGIFGAHGS